MTLGLGVTVGMFALTYLPQMAVMAFTSGPLAPISAALLVLSESSTLFTAISKTFLIEDALVDTFDGTLLSKPGTTNLVADGRQITSGNDYMGKLGKVFKKPFQRLGPKAIIRYFMYLPLNFIPVVGTVMFVVLQGKRMGPIAHARYFQLKEWDRQKREEHVEKFRGPYTRSVRYCSRMRVYDSDLDSFGVAAALLELVPIAGIFFAFTNTVGAALWAADLEKGNVNDKGTAPQLREQVKKAE